jgi:cytochrome c-type biogenesis protein CcmH/NrfG
MQEFLFHAHSGLRWLVVLATVIAFVWLLAGVAQSRPYSQTTHRVMVIWSSLIGLQWVLGLILFVVMGTFTRHHWEHLLTMTLALAAAHGHIPLKKRDDAQRYRGGLVLIVLVALLVYLGVALLPQGWFS